MRSIIRTIFPQLLIEINCTIMWWVSSFLPFRDYYVIILINITSFVLWRPQLYMEGRVCVATWMVFIMSRQWDEKSRTVLEVNKSVRIYESCATPSKKQNTCVASLPSMYFYPNNNISIMVSYFIDLLVFLVQCDTNGRDKGFKSSRTDLTYYIKHWSNINTNNGGKYWWGSQWCVQGFPTAMTCELNNVIRDCPRGYRRLAFPSSTKKTKIKPICFGRNAAGHLSLSCLCHVMQIYSAFRCCCMKKVNSK